MKHTPAPVERLSGRHRQRTVTIPVRLGRAAWTLSSPAFRGLVDAWCFASEQGLDGRLSDQDVRYVLAPTKASRRVTSELVEHGYLESLPDGDFLLVGYSCWNPSRASIERRRARWREQKRRQRERSVEPSPLDRYSSADNPGNAAAGAESAPHDDVQALVGRLRARIGDAA
ncbi:MAG: hypothetical protein M5U27_00585 [Gaiella sp.]|nr:hypothetical protein [Gaiella sp.]